MSVRPFSKRAYSSQSVEARVRHNEQNNFSVIREVRSTTVIIQREPDDRTASHFFNRKTRGPRYDWDHRYRPRRNYSGRLGGPTLDDTEGNVTTSYGAQDNSQQRHTPYARPSRKGAGRFDSGTKVKGRPGGRGSGWYKVTIPFGKKHPKKWLLTALENICSVAYTPIKYHVVQNRACFFVDDSKTASALKKCSHKITDSDGYKVVVRVRPSAPPLFRQTDRKPEEVKQVKDVNDLLPPVSVDVETPTTAPKCKESDFCPDEIKALIQRFLLQYYSIYDSGDRQPLLDAYDDGARFTLSAPRSTQNPSSSSLGEPQKDAKTMKESSTHHRLLKHTRLHVVAFLNELPKTQHDMASFNIDVNTCTNTLLSFTVSGLFKAVAADGEAAMAFSRVFTTVPAGNSGIRIINDQLHIRMATTEEISRLCAAPAPTPSSSPAPTLTALQQEMLKAFSLNSGMNLIWSQKCLQDNDWDYDRAAFVFTNLKTEGKIPDVAFMEVKT